MLEVGVLLGLMCKYSCEESTMVVYGSQDKRQVELEKGTILDNMESVTTLYEVRYHLILQENDKLVHELIRKLHCLFM